MLAIWVATMNELTLVVNYHREGHLARVSASSALRAADRARSEGATVRLLAILDRADELTRRAVESGVNVWESIEECDVGDLGLARNIAANLVNTEWMAFMDGDDLCGDRWLADALEMCEQEDCESAFLHPEWIFYFDDGDLLKQSLSATPVLTARSFYMKQVSSTDPLFDHQCLRFNNVFTSNQFGRADTFREFPFTAIDRARGFGVEDWTWNARTLAAGLQHLIVPETVHLVRVKSSGSLGLENAKAGLLPDLPASLLPGETA